MSFGYPVFLDVGGVPVLVVGGGRVACRKAAALGEAGAHVTVVAPQVSADLDAIAVAEVRRRPYEPGDLDGMRLVITATGIADVDAAVSADATARGVWVNAADRPDNCTFILPAIACAGDLRVAVSTDGTSPAIASWLHDRIGAEVLTPHVVEIAAEIAARRHAMQAAGQSTEDRDWRSEIEQLQADRHAER